MQDEPERGVCFSHKMSLKGRGVGMLGIDRPRAKRQQVEALTLAREAPAQHGDGRWEAGAADSGQSARLSEQTSRRVIMGARRRTVHSF